MIKLAILDDYNNVATRLADWSRVAERCAITVFNRHIDVAEAGQALRDFEILCTVRERMPFPRALLEALPKLRLIATTGPKHHRSLDIEAATERGILCCYTPGRGPGHNGAAELAWGLILALARHIPEEAANMRRGGWQQSVGIALAGRTLGLLGLGRVAEAMVPVARAFGMEVLAWSQNLTAERAAAHGVLRVEKDELFARSDVVSVNLMLSDRTRHLVTARELGLMKSTAYLVNTARGPIVDERDLIDVLERRGIAGAALDVFDEEPLPADHPLRRLPNCVLTPHLGYNVEELLKVFYEDTIENVLNYLDGSPIRMLNAEALQRL